MTLATARQPWALLLDGHGRTHALNTYLIVFVLFYEVTTVHQWRYRGKVEDGRAWLSVTRPSSSSCSRMLKTSGWAFSTCSSKQTRVAKGVMTAQAALIAVKVWLGQLPLRPS